MTGEGDYILMIFVLIFQVEESAVIVEPHFMDMLFEQVSATNRNRYGTGTCSAGLTDPQRKGNQHCQEYFDFDWGTRNAGFCKISYMTSSLILYTVPVHIKN
jgi:hypothetical protein